MSNAATKNQIEKIEPSPPLAVSDTAAIIQMIERAATNPQVDIDKMERLMAMRNSMIARDAQVAYDAALAKVQPRLPIVERKGKIIIRDKNDQETVKQSTPYALFEDINEAVRPILHEHGFAISFRTGLTPEGKVTVTAILSHDHGHREETTMVLPHDATGSKNAVQAVGSSTSYGKRYTMCALLNITTRGEDDDAKAAGGDEKITADQVGELQALIESVNADRDRFLKYMKVESLADIPAKKFKNAMDALKAKAKAS